MSSSLVVSISNEQLIEDLRSSDYHTRWFAAEILGTRRNLTESQIETIIDIAKDSDVGEVLIWGLGMMNMKGVEEFIGKFLEHPINYFRWRAAEALRDIGSHEAVVILMRYLAISKEAETRWKCAWALGEIGDFASAELLWDVAEKDDDRYVRWKSIWALTLLKGDLESFIMDKYKGSSLFMKWRAAWVLGRVGGDRALGWLRSRFKQEQSLYVRFQISLAIDSLVERCGNK